MITEKVKDFQPAPAAPTVSAISDISAYAVTLAALAGAEYGRSANGPWQDSPVFTGLIPDTNYAFYQRLKETSTHYVSPVSPGLTVRTSVRPNRAPTLDAVAAASGTAIAAATPASVDGSVAVRPYSVDVSVWFSDADGDPISYEIVTHDAIGPADIGISSGILTFTPALGDAGTVRTIDLLARDDRNAASETLSVAVQVGPVPANILKLEVRRDGEESIVYDGQYHYGVVSAYIGGQQAPTRASILYNHDTEGYGWIPTPPGIIDVGETAYQALAYRAGFVTSEAIRFTLRIAPRPLTVIVHDAEKVYDGQPLVASGYTIAGAGLAPGQKVGNITFSGAQTQAGTSTSGANVRVVTAQGEDVTSNYNVTVIPGKLTVHTPTPSSPKPGQDVVQGRDHFAFLNATPHFFRSGDSRTYKVTGDYYEYLLDASQAGAGVWAPLWKQVLINEMNSEWGGSCFGMSATLSLTKADRLTPGFFQSGADKLYDFSYPRDSQTVKNLINYYHLMQMTPTTNPTLAGSDDASENRRVIVEAVKSSAYPVIISFDIYYDADKEYPLGGHAVVGYDITETAGNYEIKIWDPNDDKAQSDTLTISKDYKKDSFRSGTYYPYVDLKTAHTVEDGKYDYQNIQDYLSGKSARSLRAFSAPDRVQAMAAGKSATLMTNYADFAVASSDGKSATIRNGRKVSGDLDVGDGSARNEKDAELRLSFDIPAPGAGIVYTVSPSGAGQSAYRTSLFCSMEKGYYANIESGAKGDFAFGSDGSVNARLSEPARTTIALTLDDAGRELYTTSVTGDGGGAEGVGLRPAGGGAGEVVALFSGNASIKISGDYNSVEFDNVSSALGDVTVAETDDAALLKAGGAEIAKKRKGHSVAFRTLGGTPIEALVNVPDGAAASAPAAPEKEGYAFAGWYTDPDYKAAFDFASPVTSNLTLYAKWDDKPAPATPTEPKNEEPAPGGDDAAPSEGGGAAPVPVPAAGIGANPPAPQDAAVAGDAAAVPKLSRDAALKSLKFSRGKLSPRFSRTKKSYTLKLKKGQSSVRVRAAKKSSAATVRVKIGSGKYKLVKSVNQLIKVGKGKSKILYVKITAEDGKTARIYQIRIKRARK
jgi:uncharacterized repeat protein (TIGR02543 family)